MIKTFLSNKIVSYAFYSNFAVFTNFEKKIRFLSKKTNFQEEIKKQLRQGCQNCILPVQKNFLSKSNCFQKKCFIKIITFERNFFGFVATKNSAGLSKLSSTCPEEYFEGKNLFWKNFNVWLIWHFERKFFGLWANIFRQSCQNCILSVQSPESIYFEKKL